MTDYVRLFENKRLLITGGTGSFGNAVLRRLREYPFKEIIIFSRDELKQDKMRLALKDEKVKFIIGDVRDYHSIFSALLNVDYVFHAAALKQVPSCDFYPLEAVKTNILGAENVMSACIEQKVSRVVILSTDKAVYPINAMGMSKALMERLMVAKARSVDSHNTNFCVTRYGNVMASRGSVIPLFVDQIKNGMPLTITDPEMTRFLMSLEDSVDLVLHAFSNGNQGDLFVQKAPATTIHSLANALLEIFKSDAEIQVIGTRHGEKLFESLLSKEEIIKSVETDKYYMVPMDNRSLNYDKYFVEGNIAASEAHDYNSHNTYRLSQAEVISVLRKLDYIQEKLID